MPTQSTIQNTSRRRFLLRRVFLRPRFIILCAIIDVIAVAWLVLVGEHRQDKLDTLIVEAARDQDFLEVRRLLALGANPNGTVVKAPAGQGVYVTPIHSAVVHGNIAAIKLLCDAGADLSQNPHGISLLIRAIEMNSIEVFTDLLKAGANPNSTPMMGLDFTTLHWIVELRFKQFLPRDMAIQMTRIALQYGADPDQHGMHGATPLTFAVEWQELEIVRLLLEAGADTSLTDHGGADAMDVAVLRSNEAIMELLLEHGAPYTIQEAVAFGRIDEVRTMLDEDASLIDTECYDDQNLLALALQKKQHEVSWLLIERGADLDVAFPSGMTMLHFAARSGDPTLVQQCIDRGCDVLQGDRSGDTPLHVAARLNHDNCVEVLIRAGADISARDASQNTPLLTAGWYNAPDAIRVLINAGVDPNEPSGERRRLPLGCAARQRGVVGVPKSVRVLLELGAQINARGEKGRTALHWAAHLSDNVEFIRYLLDHSADPTIRDDDGHGALGVAHLAGHERSNGGRVVRNPPKTDMAKAVKEQGILIRRECSDRTVDDQNATTSIAISTARTAHSASLYQPNRASPCVVR